MILSYPFQILEYDRSGDSMTLVALASEPYFKKIEYVNSKNVASEYEEEFVKVLMPSGRLNAVETYMLGYAMDGERVDLGKFARITEATNFEITKDQKEKITSYLKKINK